MLLGQAQRLGRVLGTSGTHPIGDWREQEIIDKPHYQRLKKKLGWLIRRNNTFSVHVHYAVNGRNKAVYLFNRLREYVPHMLALSVNSPFWQGEYTDMHSVRTLMFSRAYHRAGLPGPLSSWDEYVDYVDTLARAGLIDALGEIWWDVRLHPGLSTVEIRAFDAQASLDRTGALVSLAAALCDMLVLEYESGELCPSSLTARSKRTSGAPSVTAGRRIHGPRDPKGDGNPCRHRDPDSAPLRDHRP